MWKSNPQQLLSAIALDLALGDPRGFPHIARLAGKLSEFYENLLTARLPRTVLVGVLFWFLVVGTLLVAYRLLHFVPLLGTFVIYQSIAATDLVRHVDAIVVPLGVGDLVTARERLSWIVGRDTSELTEPEISRATIESVAESTNDGIVAPLFWATIAGPAGALIYRAANTLDSMVGHRTETYEKFGKASAVIDDVLNWIPARFSAAVFCFLSPRVKGQVIAREAAAHASPNAGWSEAAMARALGVRLGGDNTYAGEKVSGPLFNPDGREPAPMDVISSVRWMWRVAGTCALACVGILAVRRNS